MVTECLFRGRVPFTTRAFPDKGMMHHGLVNVGTWEL